MSTNLTLNVHLYLSEYTEQTAYENLRSLKDMGLHITATSPKPLPTRFYDLVDVFLHDKENLLLVGHYEVREPVYYYTRQDGFTMHFQRRENQVHGLAVLRSMIKGCELAKMNGMDWVLRIEFDDILSEISVGVIREMVERLEKDMLIFRNDYGEKRDLSVHTMLYRPDIFLRVFGRTKDESDWIDNIAKYCDYGNPILEELMLAMIEKSELDVEYLDGSTMQSILPGSVFNLHQSPTGLASGCLVDLMRCGDQLYFGAWCVNEPGGKVNFITEYEEQSYDFSPGHWSYKLIEPGIGLARIVVDDVVVIEHELKENNLDSIGSTISFNQ